MSVEVVQPTIDAICSRPVTSSQAQDAPLPSLSRAGVRSPTSPSRKEIHMDRSMRVESLGVPQPSTLGFTFTSRFDSDGLGLAGGGLVGNGTNGAGQWWDGPTDTGGAVSGGYTQERLDSAVRRSDSHVLGSSFDASTTQQESTSLEASGRVSLASTADWGYQDQQIVSSSFASTDVGLSVGLSAPQADGGSSTRFTKHLDANSGQFYYYDEGSNSVLAQY